MKATESKTGNNTSKTSIKLINVFKIIKIKLLFIICYNLLTFLAVGGGVVFIYYYTFIYILKYNIYNIMYYFLKINTQARFIKY